MGNIGVMDLENFTRLAFHLPIDIAKFHNDSHCFECCCSVMDDWVGINLGFERCNKTLLDTTKS
jgi:hypothetical protein